MNKTGVCLDCPLRYRESLDLPNNPNPDILFIGGYPISIDVERGPFMGKNSHLLKQVVETVRKQRQGGMQMRLSYSYIAQCAPEYDAENKKYQINADVMHRCSQHILEHIDTEKPKCIVALGTDAIRGLGLKGTEGDLRGGIYQIKTTDGVPIPVVCTYHIVKVSREPGLLPTLKKDINKAFIVASDSLGDQELDLRWHTEADKIVRSLTGLTEYAERFRKAKNRPLPVAIDTETSSLTPYNPNDRMIAVSLSWADLQGYAFAWEHREKKFTPDEYAEMYKALSDLVSSENIYWITANGKFDQQWIRMRYSLPLRSIKYDTMLAEHILDEDKKGEYSLKDITRDRFPSMGKYEEELHEHLEASWQVKRDEIARLTTEHKENEEKRIIEWWTGLEREDRHRFVSGWLERGIILLEDTNSLLDVQLRKYRGEMLITKKYQKSVLKMVKGLDIEERKKLGLHTELVIPPELEHETFEDAPLDVLLKYAAIDALTTRMITKDQREHDFKDDEKLLNRVKVREKQAPKTRGIFNAMQEITMPMSEVLAEMEFNGVRFDRDKARQYRETILESMAEAKDALYTEIGREFNLNSSSPDVANILFDEMHLPVLKRTDSGAPSVDADTLKQLADDHDLPFLHKLLTYRKLDKCLHTYIDNWLKMSELDGRIHCSFNQIGTATYRLSSSNPERYSRLGLL